jgi:putative PIN family toxin of toxin-antitoxin system
VRIVFDTNVLARAHPRAQGPARRALLHVASGSDDLILSPYLLWELERVLTYPRLLKRSGLTTNDIAEYLEALALISFLVTPESVPAGLLRDPTDEPILGTVLAGRAEFLCTRDTDFYEEGVLHFCSTRGVRILTDLEFLETLDAQ